MQIMINGAPQQVPEGADLSAALAVYGVAERGVAVAVDGDVVPRADWPGTAVRPGAVVEVLTAVQGG